MLAGYIDQDTVLFIIHKINESYFYAVSALTCVLHKIRNPHHEASDSTELFFI